MEPQHGTLQTSDLDPALWRLFDEYVHGFVDRRGFLDRAAKFAVGGVTAAALLEALSPKFAQAQKVAPSDERIHTQFVELPSPDGNGKVRGYLVRPKKATGKLPAVLVVHENRGLNPHIEDVARRFGLEGYLVFAPDALFTLGGYPGDEDKARELFAKLDGAKTVEDFVASAHYLKAHPEGNGKLGVVGFCWGGGMAHTLATRLPDVDAVVPFYGPAPAPEMASKVKAELLLHLAETDDRVNATVPPYEAALKAAHVKFQAYTYPGTQHGFHNDTTPRFNAAAAKLAWTRTLDFFKRKLHADAKATPGTPTPR